MLLKFLLFVVAFAVIAIGAYFLLGGSSAPPGPGPRPDPDPSRHNITDKWPIKSKVYLDVNAVQQFIYKSWPANNDNVLTALNLITDLKKNQDIDIPGYYTWAEPRSIQQSIVVFKPHTTLSDLQAYITIGVNWAGVMGWKDGFSQFKPNTPHALSDPVTWTKFTGLGLTHLQNVYKQYTGPTAANDAIQSIRDLEKQGIQLAGYYTWNYPPSVKHAVTFTPGTKRLQLDYFQWPSAVVSFRPGLQN